MAAIDPPRSRPPDYPDKDGNVPIECSYDRPILRCRNARYCDDCFRFHVEEARRETARAVIKWLEARQDENPDAELHWLLVEFIDDFGLEDGDG